MDSSRGGAPAAHDQALAFGVSHSATTEMTAGRTDLSAAQAPRSRPARIRVRRLDGGDLFPASGISDATVRIDELARHGVSARGILILSNEAVFDALPELPRAIAFLGSSSQLAALRELPWLTGRRIHYWADIDTAGFSQLDQLRASLPQTASVLMDAWTLWSHREQWTRELMPSRHVLPHLTVAESVVYADLVSDTLAPSVRLRQESIDESTVLRELARALR